MGPLTGARCDSMLRDNSHLFRAMWGAVPWTTQNTQRCWEVTRDAGRSQQDPTVFMDGIRSGAHCTTTNWLLGNRPAAHNELPRPIEHLRDIGRPTFVANYTAPAPALLGFDWSVHQHCSSQLKAKLPYSDFEHAAACVAANRNILWLKENSRVAYNLCRNLEWLSCAARGQLRGQRASPTLVFARPVRLLNTDGGALPLDGCRKEATGARNSSATHPQKCPHGAQSYTSADVFFLEVCMLSWICSNGADLFAARAKATNETSSSNVFVCEYSAERMETLFRTLAAPVGAAAAMTGREPEQQQDGARDVIFQPIGV